MTGDSLAEMEWRRLLGVDKEPGDMAEAKAALARSRQTMRRAMRSIDPSVTNSPPEIKGEALASARPGSPRAGRIGYYILG